MKKIPMLFLFAFTTILLFSCKETKKEEVEKLINENSLVIDETTTTINWIAYKTTSKVPVKGQFNKFTTSPTKGTTVKDVINGLKFSIPVNSLHTNDTIRDTKLKKFFFGSLENTTEITGTLYMESETNGKVEISMNGISQIIPVNYTVNNLSVAIESVLDLDNWKAQAAIEALNVVCFDLHKGEDGISKTWNEVKIEVFVNLKQE